MLYVGAVSSGHTIELGLSRLQLFLLAPRAGDLACATFLLVGTSLPFMGVRAARAPLGGKFFFLFPQRAAR